MSANQYAVFTKPWKKESLDELGELVRNFGFDAVEYPLRDGYQVQPSDGVEGIKKLVKTLEKHNVKVASMAASYEDRATGKLNETVFAGCGEAGVPIIRICQTFNRELGWHENMDAIRRKYDAVVLLSRKYGVTLGVQMHYGFADINGSWDSYILLKDYDPKCIAAVWDAGHAGLAGENPKNGLDCLWNNLCMVNFKNAYWFRKNPANLAEEAQWSAYWVTGKSGMCNWKVSVEYLKKRNYKGVVCLPAEYSDEPNVEIYTREDVKYIKGLFGG